MKELSTKTVNNVLTVCNKLLKVAVEWGVLDKLPVTIKLLKAQKPTRSFYDFEEYERLVEAASNLDWRIQAMVPLGGDAGLRSGEILALEWTDVDFRRGQLHIRQSEWQGHVTVPKGRRDQRVPMTKRLAALLAANRRLKGPRVLYRDNRPARDQGGNLPLDGEGAEAGRASGDTSAPCSPAHLLLAAGDARSARQGHPGTRPAREPLHHPAAVHAPVPGGQGRGDQPAL